MQGRLQVFNNQELRLVFMFMFRIYLMENSEDAPSLGSDLTPENKKGVQSHTAHLILDLVLEARQRWL